jgi:predicted phosphodiesterase
MGNQTLTWIHLSDLHIKDDDLFNRKVVFEALWQDIKEFIDKGIRPDFIAFTGDVSYHGSLKEYNLAIAEFFDPLLSVTQISKERLFVIPGNHDVNRNRSKFIKNPIPEGNLGNKISKMLQDSDQKELLLSPFSNYRKFVLSYLFTDYNIKDPELSFSQNFVQDDFLISIVGLNSAWLSGFNLDKNGQVDDFGKLAISEYLLREAVPIGAQIKIILMHHPTEWLFGEDRNQIEAFLAKNSCIILRGHLHRPDTISVSTLFGNVVVIPSGAVFDNRNSPNSYNIVQIDLKNGEGIVYLRRYNNIRNEWQKDIESTGEKGDGKSRFKVPGYFSSSSIEDEPTSSNNVRNYSITFTDDCKSDISSLNLSEEHILNLVQGEFRSHLNYFRFDIEDYPLPVRPNYIVFLSKIGHDIEFRRVVPCSRNESQLASWNDILSLYRRATRMAYRQEPLKLIQYRGMSDRICNLHMDMRLRIEKHYLDFYNIIPTTTPISEEHRFVDEKVKERLFNKNKEVNSLSNQEYEEMRNEIYFHLLQSFSACQEVTNLQESIDIGDIKDNQAIGMMLVEFERSLQYIHKIILRYPPIKN